MNIKSQPILIVEDSDEDYMLTIRAFNRSGLANPVFRCENGDKALDFLLRRAKYADPETSPRPGIILLDLNLPRTDGREVLRQIKENSKLRKIPVIILTTSDNEQDVDECYAKGANSFIQKPTGFENFMNAIRQMKGYWFEIVILPEAD